MSHSQCFEQLGRWRLQGQAAFWLIPVGCSALVSQVAIAAPLPALTPQQVQRIQRDLVPPRSQEFFRQQQTELEREVQRLTRPQPTPHLPLLQVDPSSQYHDRQTPDFFKRNPTSLRQPTSPR